ncbi:MAG: NUDIX hydrolase [Gemmataceae bacterium]
MKIKKLEQVTRQRWLNLFVVDYDHNGHEGQWVFASRNEKPFATHDDAVVIVPVLRNPGQPPRLVMIREFRVPIGDYVYGLPAGLVERGEPIEGAIRREMHEETGYEVTKVRRVTQPMYTTPGLSDEAVSMAFIDVTGDENTKAKPEASEDIEVLLLDHPAICRLCQDKSARIDVKAWVVLHLFEQLGRLE